MLPTLLGRKKYEAMSDEHPTWKPIMVAEILKKSKFLLYALYLCYIKFYFDYIFDIHVIYFITYLSYIYMYIIKHVF